MDSSFELRHSTFLVPPAPVAGNACRSYPNFEPKLGNTEDLRDVKGHDRTSRRLLIAIVLALAGWGLFLAVGAYLGMWDRTPQDGGTRDPRRFWIVLGAVGAFLAFWGAALAFRARRNRSRRK